MASDVLQATPGDALAETAMGETCTFRRTSVLTLNVTRIGQGKRLVVRCRVNHPTQGNSNPEACQDPDVDYCRMSQQFDIQCKSATSLSVCHNSHSTGPSTSSPCCWGSVRLFCVCWVLASRHLWRYTQAPAHKRNADYTTLNVHSLKWTAKWDFWQMKMAAQNVKHGRSMATAGS